MRPKFSIAAVLFLSVLIAWSGIAYAEELYPTCGSLNALNSDYAITRWPWDGGEIFIFEEAQVRACTILPPPSEGGSGPTHVVFRWNRPDGSSEDSELKPLTHSVDTWKGDDIYDAYDTFTIDMLGDWGVQALFQGEGGRLMGPNDPYETVNIKAISWHAIPEVPFGTLAILIAMFGALTVFAMRRKRMLPTP